MQRVSRQRGKSFTAVLNGVDKRDSISKSTAVPLTLDLTASHIDRNAAPWMQACQLGNLLLRISVITR